ncbi:hypothetical protein ACHAXS_000042 [Conticribra weissflogii]
MYMELPQGIETTHGSGKTHVFQLISNLYGQKQAGRVWNQYLFDKLLDAGYVQSQIDNCIFYKGNILFIVYADDGIFLGASEEQLLQEIKLLQKLRLDIEDQGHPSDYVGVNIQHHQDGPYKFTQQVLINTILDDVGLKPSYKKKLIPMKSSWYLSHHINSIPFYDCNSIQFNYRSIIGKLNYLAQTSRPDIIFAVHQLAQYLADPQEDHGMAVE